MEQLAAATQQLHLRDQQIAALQQTVQQLQGQTDTTQHSHTPPMVSARSDSAQPLLASPSPSPPAAHPSVSATRLTPSSAASSVSAGRHGAATAGAQAHTGVVVIQGAGAAVRRHTLPAAADRDTRTRSASQWSEPASPCSQPPSPVPSVRTQPDKLQHATSHSSATTGQSIAAAATTSAATAAAARAARAATQDEYISRLEATAREGQAGLSTQASAPVLGGSYPPPAAHHLDWAAMRSERRETPVVCLFGEQTAETARTPGQPVASVAGSVVGTGAAELLGGAGSWQELPRRVTSDGDKVPDATDHALPAAPVADAAEAAHPAAWQHHTLLQGLRREDDAAPAGASAFAPIHAAARQAPLAPAWTNIHDFLGSGYSDYGGDAEDEPVAGGMVGEDAGNESGSQRSDWETVDDAAGGRDSGSDTDDQWHAHFDGLRGANLGDMGSSDGYDSEDSMEGGMSRFERIPAPVMHGRAQVWTAEPEPAPPPRPAPAPVRPSPPKQDRAAQIAQAYGVGLKGTGVKTGASPKAGALMGSWREAAHRRVAAAGTHAGSAAASLWHPDVHLPADRSGAPMAGAKGMRAQGPGHTDTLHAGGSHTTMARAVSLKPGLHVFGTHVNPASHHTEMPSRVGSLQPPVRASPQGDADAAGTASELAQGGRVISYSVGVRRGVPQAPQQPAKAAEAGSMAATSTVERRSRTGYLQQHAKAQGFAAKQQGAQAARTGAAGQADAAVSTDGGAAGAAASHATSAPAQAAALHSAATHVPHKHTSDGGARNAGHARDAPAGLRQRSLPGAPSVGHGAGGVRPAPRGSAPGVPAGSIDAPLPSDELFDAIKRQLASLQATFVQAGNGQQGRV